MELTHKKNEKKLYFSHQLLKLISYPLYVCIAKVLIDVRLKQANLECFDFLLDSDCMLLKTIRFIPSITHKLGLFCKLSSGFLREWLSCGFYFLC